MASNLEKLRSRRVGLQVDKERVTEVLVKCFFGLNEAWALYSDKYTYFAEVAEKKKKFSLYDPTELEKSFREFYKAFAFAFHSFFPFIEKLLRGRSNIAGRVRTFKEKALAFLHNPHRYKSQFEYLSYLVQEFCNLFVEAGLHTILFEGETLEEKAYRA